MQAAFAPGHPVPASFASLTALDPLGSPVTLGQLWADQPAVLVWVRHFG
jgi:hypothetical protein